MSTTTDTPLTVTLLAIAERQRGQAERMREDAKARKVAEYRATVAEILAAAEDIPDNELSPSDRVRLAELAEYAAAGNPRPSAEVTGWRTGSVSLPDALYIRCPAAIAEIKQHAEDFIASPTVLKSKCLWRLWDRMLPSDMVAAVRDALAVMEAQVAEKAAEDDARREAEKAEREQSAAERMAQLDALARIIFADDFDALAGWEAGEIRPQEVEGRVATDLRSWEMSTTKPKFIEDVDSCNSVERVSVAAYRQGREIVAHLTKVATEYGRRLGRPVSVERRGYHRQTESAHDEWGAVSGPYWTADYTVTIGALQWSVDDVILD